jgi:hypothetical protein
MGNRKGSLRLLTQEQHDWFEETVPGRSYREMRELLQSVWGVAMTEGQVKSFMARHHLRNRRDARFKPGCAPINKGRKGIRLSPQTEFKPGHRPANWKPVGSERISKDGYVEVKVGEPKKWQHKHVFRWEQAHGPRPKGHAVIFADGNKRNFSLDNLILVSRHELLVLNRLGLLHSDADLSRSGIAVAKLITEIENRQKAGKKHVETRAGSLKKRQAERSKANGNYDGAV